MLFKKIAFPFILLIITSFHWSCTPSDKRKIVTSPPNSINNQESSSIAKRFEEPASKGKTVVESAIELSEKYARLSEQTSELRDRNKDLINENARLKKQVVTLEDDLKQTQKELAEANQLLIDILNELNIWKSDILGFRNEMREAAKAQLEALLKVLEVLGGEVETETTQLENIKSSGALTDQMEQPKTPVPNKKDE